MATEWKAAKVFLVELILKNQCDAWILYDTKDDLSQEMSLSSSYTKIVPFSMINYTFSSITAIRKSVNSKYIAN